ncbi:MAG: HD domain-containing protein [Chloroflexi bacterium]|nr:HD domain-containing protein [Chloroflexota bacterium]
MPTGETAWIPSDLELRVPEKSLLDAARLHYLLYIPWAEKYLRLVPNEYKTFFTFALPFLAARTTDVHVANCLPFARELIAATPQATDARVIHIAFILHDSGWSQMSDAEIADSLGVKGVALSGAAVSPKEKHARLGRDIAARVLNEYRFDAPLSTAQKELICTAILYHDKPWELAHNGDIPIDVKLVCDVDHLWSFTRENFWQDTVRKNVHPREYLENLAQDLDGYFTTEQGKNKARALLHARRAEVQAWEQIKNSR